MSGNYEYANIGFQNWRYHGEPDCLALSADGTRAALIGPVTLSQGDSPALSTRVGFIIDDGGKGKDVDRARAFFAGNLSCQNALGLGSGRPTSGNYTISRR